MVTQEDLLRVLGTPKRSQLTSAYLCLFSGLAASAVALASRLISLPPSVLSAVVALLA